MPFLALKRDTVGDHPIINDLCRNDFTASTLFLCIGDGRGGHRSVNVLCDRLQICWSDRFIHIRVDILCQRHAPDVVDRLFYGHRLAGQVRLVPFGFPF